MDEDREYREVDEGTFDRYVRYAFRPTAGPPGAGSTGDGDEDEATGSGASAADDLEVERVRRGLYRPDREAPVAVAGYHDFRARLRGEYHRLGGVTTVATPPEHRRRGYVRDLLGRMLDELRTEGVEFSALWPFKRSFYRRLGWETGSRYIRVEAPPEQLRSAAAEPAGEFRATEAGEWARLVPVLEAHDAGRDLHLDRTEAWWRRRIFEGWGDEPYVYRWEADGEPRAYLTYVIEEDDDREGRTLGVREAAWADHRARRQLWRFLGDHDSQVGTVRLVAPFDPAFPLLETVDDPSSVTVEVEAGHMIRLNDVAAGLSSLAYPSGGADEVRVGVDDPLVGANDRTFALTVEEGRADCLAVEADPDVSLGVGRLSQLAVGYRDASAMAATGHLDAPADVIERLDALFPAVPVWLREGF
ncbi:MAG: GNAT family N-acetyltransferase [Haloarculaceae archaeon]